MELSERFMKYVSIPTSSNSQSKTSPSTETQKVFARMLANELEELLLDKMILDEEHGYVYALKKGKPDIPKIAFISHMDTSETEKGMEIKPQKILNYAGQDIILKKEIVLERKNHPNLEKQIGKTLITTDGTTLLGADDKAGICEIMEMLVYFNNHPEEEHGDIWVCFTPDEEIGRGTAFFDLDTIQADFGYTVDGSEVGEISYENFYAATVNIEIKGINTHCGSAKNKMVNSITIANELQAALPKEVPETTEKYEGFYHLQKMNGTVAHTEMKYLLRDFTKEGMEQRKQTIQKVVFTLNKQYGECITLQITNQYANMKEVIEKHKEIIYYAENATKKVGIEPKIIPIRGGTDGARLSFMGLPCPNLGTGGHNFHSVYEYISLEDMEKAVQILIEIIKECAKGEKNKCKRLTLN